MWDKFPSHDYDDDNDDSDGDDDIIKIHQCTGTQQLNTLYV